MVRKLIWPFGGLSLIALALAIFAISKRYPGPNIMPFVDSRVADGRGLTGADLVAFVPLLVGTAHVVVGLWRRRERLRRGVRLSLDRAEKIILAVGAALGLLLAAAALLTLPTKRPAFVVFVVVVLATSMLIAARR